MPFLEHLEELRRTVLFCFGVIFVGALVVYAFSGPVVDYIIVKHVGQAQVIKPMEAFLSRIKVSLLGGLLVSLPFVAFKIWHFIVPGLLNHERRLVVPLGFFSTVLFLAGTAFSYLVLTPIMIKLLLGFATESMINGLSVEYLFDFIIKMAMACGILFQLPLVVAILTIVRLVTPKFLLSKWRHAIVIILIIAAVATPGDGPSQVVLAAPIIVLYFVSILISVAIVRSREEDEENDDDDDDDDDGDDGGGGDPSSNDDTRVDDGVSAAGDRVDESDPEDPPRSGGVPVDPVLESGEQTSRRQSLTAVGGDAGPDDDDPIPPTEPPEGAVPVGEWERDPSWAEPGGAVPPTDPGGSDDPVGPEAPAEPPDPPDPLDAVDRGEDPSKRNKR